MHRSPPALPHVSQTLSFSLTLTGPNRRRSVHPSRSWMFPEVHASVGSEGGKGQGQLTGHEWVSGRIRQILIQLALPNVASTDTSCYLPDIYV